MDFPVDMSKEIEHSCPLSNGDVAQLVRAHGSYPWCPGFKSLHRHQNEIRSVPV